MDKLKFYRFFILFATLLNLILTPLEATIFQIQGGLLTLVNYTLIILASLLVAQRKNVQIVTIATGIITLSFVWIEYFATNSSASACRMFATLFLFSIVIYILFRNFVDAKEMNLRVVFGAMAGYLLIGIIGGVLFEMLDFFYAGSVNVAEGSGGYDFYYYSFISVVTVGFGDITPVSAAAKSLTIFLSVAGQFYMAVGVSLFIGKYLNTKTN
ncbi:MAG: voltage-gated potassium channel [Saprospiraceae bacterium]|jgi:voltage-gated potassium channel